MEGTQSTSKRYTQHKVRAHEHKTSRQTGTGAQSHVLRSIQHHGYAQKKSTKIKDTHN